MMIVCVLKRKCFGLVLALAVDVLGDLFRLIGCVSLSLMK